MAKQNFQQPKLLVLHTDKNHYSLLIPFSPFLPFSLSCLAFPEARLFSSLVVHKTTISITIILIFTCLQLRLEFPASAKGDVLCIKAPCANTILSGLRWDSQEVNHMSYRALETRREKCSERTIRFSQPSTSGRSVERLEFPLDFYCLPRAPGSNQE